jgi:hypothetical protein
VPSSTEARRSYVPLRGIASAISLLLAVWYSSDLGVLNRSYLAVIMVSCSLSIVAFTSGTTLTLRSLKGNQVSKSLRTSYSACILIEFFSSMGFFVVCLVAFSNIKEALPMNLIIIALVYYIAAFLHTITMEFLLYIDSFHTAAKLELITVLLQIVCFFLMRRWSSFSIASSVLVSFAIPYLVICIFTIWKTHSRGFNGFSNPVEFWMLTRGKHMFGSVIGVLDRLDRILIAFLLPTINLGQYATMGSLLSFFRFLPESISKILVSGPVNAQFKFIRKKFVLFVVVLLLVTSIIIISRFLIEKVLGPEWLLSVSIYICFALYEIFRGLFQIGYNQRLAKSKVPNNWVIVNLLVLSLILAVFLGKALGLVGIPLAFGIAYLISLRILKVAK